MECEHLKSLAQSNGLKESVAGFDERAYQGEIEDALQQAGICKREAEAKCLSGLWRFYIFVIFAWIFHRKIVMYLVGRKCYLRGRFFAVKVNGSDQPRAQGKWSWGRGCGSDVTLESVK